MAEGLPAFPIKPSPSNITPLKHVAYYSVTLSFHLHVQCIPVYLYVCIFFPDRYGFRTHVSQ